MTSSARRFKCSGSSTQASHDVRDVFAGGFNIMQKFFALFAKIWLAAGQEIAEADDWRKRVVDIVSDATGHLAQGFKPLLLHDCLLCLA